MHRGSFRSLLVSTVIFLAASFAFAQTTAFKYQGKLNENGTAASGAYQLQFRLYDSPSGGSQIGSTISDVNVTVAEGIFAAELDFGSAVFGGASRYLEISVRRNSGESYTTLFPREQITSSPFSVRTLSAVQADFAANAGNANTANSAVNFTAPLAGDVTGSQNSTTVARLQNRTVANTAPSNGQVLKYNAANSRWEPANDETASGGGGGTITGVTAGTGLTGGGTSGSVTVGIANGGVGNAQLGDGSVSTAKLADATVSTAKIADSAISNTKLADGVVSTPKLADNAVNAAKLADGSVSTPKIVDNNVTDPKIASVSGAKVTGAVANATNATTAVNFTGPLAGDVTGTQAATSISNSAVTTPKLADNAVTSQKIGTGQVVKSLNSLKDDVTLAAGTNITITPAGNTLTIAATGAASGVTGGGTVGRVPLFSGASAIGDSLISQAAGEINMPSVVRFAEANGFQTNVGTPNTQTGITFSGTGARADIRYNGTMRIVNGTGGIPANENGIAISTQGLVSIGSSSFSSARLYVRAAPGDAIFGQSSSGGTGVLGFANSPGSGHAGVLGSNPAGIGVRGDGVTGVSGDGISIGVAGFSASGTAVDGLSTSGVGVYGSTNSSNSFVPAVHGESFGNGGVGVRGDATSGVSTGVLGSASAGTGVTGQSNSGTGVFGSSSSGLAGWFAGRVRVDTLANGGSGFPVCRVFGSNELSNCSASSVRFKKNITHFTPGLSVLNRLRPVSFVWKNDDTTDVGLLAEEIAKVEPLLAFHTEKGEVEGVKYDRINLVLINAIKEQQAQIAALRAENRAMARRLRAVERKVRPAAKRRP